MSMRTCTHKYMYVVEKKKKGRERGRKGRGREGGGVEGREGR